jgi:hypothetical protein
VISWDIQSEGGSKFIEWETRSLVDDFLAEITKIFKKWKNS